jgi:hypothetical protein
MPQILTRPTVMASLVALPVTLALILAFARGTTPTPDPGPLSRDAATVAVCTRLIATLPQSLDGLAASPPPLADILSWGGRAVTLRCGTTRPAELSPIAMLTLIAGADGHGVYWLANDDNTTFTVVDRAVFIDVDVSAGTVAPLPSLSDAIAAVLPRVCITSAERASAVAPALALCAER